MRGALGLLALAAIVAAAPAARAQQDDDDDWQALEQRAAQLREAGRFADAAQVSRREIAQQQQQLGESAPQLGVTWSQLGVALEGLGDFDQALAAEKRGVALVQPSNDPGVIGVVTANLGELELTMGNLHDAEVALARAMGMLTSANAAPRSIALTLNNLAEVYRAEGRFGEAEPLYQQALDALGDDGTADDVATIENNIGMLFQTRGDRVRAEPWLVRALELREKALGPHPLTAQSYNNLGLLYSSHDELDRAEPLFVKALAMEEQVEGRDHPDLILPLTNLADVYEKQRKLDRAQASIERALSIAQKKLGPTHPEVGAALTILGGIQRSRGDFAGAMQTDGRAADALRGSLGVSHPDVAVAMHNMAIDAWRMGDVAKALTLKQQADDVRERHVAQAMTTGSERDRMIVLRSCGAELDFAISLHQNGAPNDAAARALAMQAILRRKGREVDAMSDTVTRLRERLDARGQELLAALTQKRAALARLAYAGGGGDVEQAHALARDADAIEAQIAQRSADFQVAAEPVTAEAIAKLIPERAVLVEIVRYQPYRRETGWQRTERYTAYALTRAGEVRWVDLGEAAPIDQLTGALRAALSDPAKDARAPARALDEKVMRPIRALTAGAREVLLAPDDALNLVPFGALVDENGQYLLPRTSFTYLGSGRELLRRRLDADPRGGPVVLAAPAFGDEGDGASGASRAVVSDLSRAYFTDLPGTADEARALAALMPDATVLTGAGATKAALRGVHGPRILHVATHGYFLAPSAKGTDHARAFVLDVGGGAAPAANGDNPLLLSGLALAGANRAKAEGLISAYEMTELDLWGTQLVVLSACETGLGETFAGDGVFGLRRALARAGAETAIISLWKVDDAATRDLMTAFYRGVTSGGGRTESLRQAQLAMLAGGERAHPYYWASFIPSGDPRTLAGADVEPAVSPQAAAAGAPAPPPPAPKPHACGCHVVGAPAGGAIVLAPLAWAIAMLRRRRARS